MIKRIAITAVAAVAAGVGGAVTATTFNGAASQVPETKTAQVLHMDHAAVASAAEISNLSDVVVKGQFTGKISQGWASNYRMASSGAGDVPVTLWTFRVERSFKGVTGADVVVVAYDTDALVSRDVPTIAAGAQAVLFLTEKVHGARVIVAGEQGMLTVAGGGRLKASSPTGSFPDARDEAALSRAIH